MVAIDDQAVLDRLEGSGLVASVTPLAPGEGTSGGAVAAVVASPNPSAALRLVESTDRWPRERCRPTGRGSGAR